MTFKDVIVKNFFGQLKKYMAYFLSCTFCILFFFMYATIVFNKSLNNSNGAEMLQYALPLTIVCIFFFSIFFTSYAHNSFIKGRNMEFGVYFTLGMHQKDLCRLVLYENVIIAIVSLLTGIGIGSLASRLFQMLVSDILNLDNIPFKLDYRSFLVTIVLFVVVFTYNILRSTRRLKHSDIQTMLHEMRKSQGRKKMSSNAILGCAGILILLVSLLYLYVLCSHPDLLEKPLLLMLYLLVAYGGLYLMTYYGGNFIINTIKKSRFYMKKMLSITQIHYRYHQNQKIVFVLSILISITVFIVASPFSLLEISENIATANGEAIHLEYCIMNNQHSNATNFENSIFEAEEIKRRIEIPFYELKYKDDTVPVISASIYNQYMEDQVIVSKGECINLLLTWIPGNGGVNVGDTMTFTNREQNYEFTAIFSNRGDFVAKSYPIEQMIVLNDLDYEQIAKKTPDDSFGNYYLTDFNDWKDVKDETLTFYEQIKDEVRGIKCVAYSYEECIRMYSTFLLLCGMLGILFFIAAGSVIYFKQYTELPQTKKTFYKLYKIGITKKEVGHIVGTELKVVFFTPMFFGSFLGLSLIYLMTHIVGGSDSIRPFMKNASFIVAIYFLCQMLFYFMTKRKYVHELTTVQN